MKRLNRILALSGILLLLAVFSAWAQPAMPGGGGGGRGPGGGMQYDPKNLETVSGEVTQVQMSPRRTKGVHLQMKTDKETLVVLLGPSSYLEQQKMNIAVGDKVEIKGSRIQHPQQAILIAGELKKGNQVVKFRDEQGLPLWSRGGPRGKLPAE